MPTSPTNRAIDHLCRAALLPDGARRGDGELLDRFIECRDEAALAALVRRHGPMVWGVCRRALRDYHDAEDAFQATFLVLVRKARSVVPRAMVGNWLHGVARRAAMQAQRVAARRGAREVQVTDMSNTPAARHDPSPDFQPALDEELSRLPEIYRAVIVLCDLEGRTRKEVARQLGVPDGTVGGRLARARAMLAKRLARRGVTLSAGALTTALSQGAASVGVPAPVMSKTIKVTSLVATGQATVAGTVSGEVAALTEGVLKAMLVTKLKVATAVVFAAVAVCGTAGLLYRTMAGEPGASAQPRTTRAPVARAATTDAPSDLKAAAPAAEPGTVWGEPVNGLKAGLRSPKQTLGRGESVEVELVLKNNGTSAVALDYPTNYGLDGTPDRGSVRLGWGARNTKLRRAETYLPPGEVVVRGRVTLCSDQAGAPGTGVVRLAPGTYRVSVPDVGGAGDRLSLCGPAKGTGGKPAAPEWIDLSDLGTGVLEVTVTDEEPVRAAPAKTIGAPLPKAEEPAWKAEFRKAYGLADGELIRRVPSPYPKCRAEYFEDLIREFYKRIKMEAPAEVLGRDYTDFFTTFGWKDGWTADNLTTQAQPVKPDEGVRLVQLIHMTTGFRHSRTEGDTGLLEAKVTGDFVVRVDADPAKLAAALEKILRKECGLNVSLEVNEVERDVYVLSGKYESKPLPDREKDVEEIYGFELTDPVIARGGIGNLREGSGSLREMADHLEGFIGIPVVVGEVEGVPKRVEWHFHSPSPATDKQRARDADADKIMKDLAAQTELTARREKRKISVLTVKKEKFSFPYFLPGSRIVIGKELVDEVNALASKDEQIQFLLKILPPKDQKERRLSERQLYAMRLLGLTDSDVVIGPLLDRFEFVHKSDGWPAVHALGRLGERAVEPVVKKLQSVATDRQKVATLNAALIEIKGKQFPKFIDELKRRKDVKLPDKILNEMLDQYRFAPND